jgi:hypothetical protein
MRSASDGGWWCPCEGVGTGCTCDRATASLSDSGVPLADENGCDVSFFTTASTVGNTALANSYPVAVLRICVARSASQRWCVRSRGVMSSRRGAVASQHWCDVRGVGRCNVTHGHRMHAHPTPFGPSPDFTLHDTTWSAHGQAGGCATSCQITAGKRLGHGAMTRKWLWAANRLPVLQRVQPTLYREISCPSNTVREKCPSLSSRIAKSPFPPARTASSSSERGAFPQNQGSTDGRGGSIAVITCHLAGACGPNFRTCSREERERKSHTNFQGRDVRKPVPLHPLWEDGMAARNKFRSLGVTAACELCW